MIDRNDMLELTRRMTPSRNCFFRVAGAYVDKDLDMDTFNIHFGKLGAAETKQKLDMTKAVVFSETNENLREYKFGDNRKKSLWPLLVTLKDNGLKDDAMLDTLYEIIGENYRASDEYGIFLFYGSYDVPVKAKDKTWLEGSEEVYDFIICAIAPLEGEYEPGKPEFGFLFPAFADRSADIDRIYIYQADGVHDNTELLKLITGN